MDGFLRNLERDIQVDVDFYSDEEKRKFLSGSLAKRVEDIPRRLVLAPADVLTYYLYYKKAPTLPGYSTHKELSEHVREGWEEWKGKLEISNGSVRWIPNARCDRGTTERIGEALSLSVASKLHGLHEADWDRIPESRDKKKTLDFSYPWEASDGREFILLEAKGTSSESVSKKSDSVHAHKKSIVDKKRDVPQEERKKAVMYGTIAVVPKGRNEIARCWLVDPPSAASDDPKAFKVVKRLSFIAGLARLISPRSALVAALQTRLGALNVVERIDALDGVSLKKGNGAMFDPRSPVFAGRSSVLGEEVIGDVTPVTPNSLIFVGIREELLSLAVSQSFGGISTYKSAAELKQGMVHCMISKGRFEREFLREVSIPRGAYVESGGYCAFNLDADLLFSEGGLVTGFVSVPDEWQKV